MLNLTHKVLQLFAEGTLPATTVQTLIAAAWADGWGRGDAIAERLKNVGAEGKCPGNALRDLLRVVKSLGIGDATPDPYIVSVKTAGCLHRNVGVFLPHEQLKITVDTHGIDAYRVSSESWVSDSGVGALLRDWGDSLGIQIDSRDVLALGIHADGVSYSTTQRAGSTKSVLAAAWNIISAEMPAHRARRHLFFALAKQLCCDCGCEGRPHFVSSV